MSSNKSLLGQFFRYCIPTVLSLWVFCLYSMVDGMFVARGVSELALSAVNIAMPFTYLLFAVAMLFAVGTSTVAAILSGQGDQDKANRVFTQNVVLLAVVGLLLTALLYLFVDPITSFLGATAETEALVRRYLLGIAPFCMSFVVSYSLEILVKTDGFPKLATIAVTSGALLNCLLDYVFVFVFQWGVWGAAFATGLSQTLVMILYIIHFVMKRGKFRLTKFRFDGAVYRRIIPIGIPDGLTELSAAVVVFLFNRAILRFLGVEAVVSYSIIAYISNLVVMTMAGVSQGIQPLVSFYRGTGELHLSKRLFRYALVTVGVISVVGFGVILLFSEPLVGIFIADTASALGLYSIKVLCIYSISFLLVGYNVVAVGYLTAVEEPKYAISISMGRSFVFLAAGLLLLTSLFGGAGIWWATTLSEGVCLILSAVLLRRWFRAHKTADIEVAGGRESHSTV